MPKRSPTTAPRRAGGVARRLVFAAALAAVLSGCAGSRPSTSGATVVRTDAIADGATSSRAGTSVPAPAAASPTTSAVGASALPPSGDAALDQMDADLAAFENESASLDQAAAATQETNP
jgi:hypothetical protein